MNVAESTAQQAVSMLAPEISQVLSRVHIYAERRAAWLRYLQEESYRNESADNNQNSEQLGKTANNIDSATAGFYCDDPAHEARWQQDFCADVSRDIAVIDNQQQAQENGRLNQLVTLFGLDAPDCDLLQTCLALALEPNLDASLGFLQGYSSRNYITDYLIARLYGYGQHFPLNGESALLRWGLVQPFYPGPGEPRGWQIDQQILRWLLGFNDLHSSLLGVAQMKAAQAPLMNWPIDNTTTFFDQVLQTEAGGAVVEVVGYGGSGRRTFAACVSAKLGLPLLVVDCAAIEAGSFNNIYRWAQRQAFLDRCALAWLGIGADGASVLASSAVTAFPVQFVISDQTAISDQKNWHRVSLEKTDRQERETLWQRFIPELQTLPADQFAMLARRHVHIGDIESIARQGVSDYQSVNELVSRRQRDQLDGLAERVTCPFTRDDLIVNDAVASALHDFLFEARERDSFWQNSHAARLFPRGQGLVALFSGPPGTGKTMAAQIIAAELGLDLFRVDLASVVSKYVGETSQNLARIIRRAADMDIVLLFDEADALFSKRTEVKDAHDRFANTDTNYLLQAIESFPGIAVLATNKKGNLDPAFIRRLRFLLEFNAPEYSERLRLWRQLLGELAGEENAKQLDTGLKKLARQLNITGAQIKFSILSALFTARRLNMPLSLEHLVQGVDRELAKEGRRLSEQESTALLRK